MWRIDIGARKAAIFLEGVVTAYGLICTADGMVTKNRDKIMKAKSKIEKLRKIKNK